jgi:hypothetical protein
MCCTYGVEIADVGLAVECCLGRHDSMMYSLRCVDCRTQKKKLDCGVICAPPRLELVSDRTSGTHCPMRCKHLLPIIRITTL